MRSVRSPSKPNVEVRRVLVVIVMVWLSLLLKASHVFGDPLQVTSVWEREFDFPVVDFAVGEKISGGSYLKVVLTESDYEDIGSVYFFNEGIQLMEKLEIPCVGEARLSKNGNYVGLVVPSGVDSDEVPMCRFTMYDSQGNQLWSMDSTWCPSEFYILGHGDRIAYVDDWGGVIEFFDSSGRRLRVFQPFSCERSLPHLGIFGDVSLDGRFLALNVGCSCAGGTATLILVDKDGNELWRRQLTDSTEFDVAISGQGNIIVALAETYTRSAYVLNSSGTILHTYPVTGWVPFKLSDDGKILTIAMSRHVVSACSVQTGQQMWQYTNPDTAEMFTSVDVCTGDTLRVLGGVTTVDWKVPPGSHPIADLSRLGYLFDSDAGTVWCQEFSGAGYWSLGGPLVRFASPEGREFFVANRMKVYHYRY